MNGTERDRYKVSRPVAVALLIGYVACVVAANELTTHYGLIPVGFGLMATAGTWAIGGVILLRDLVQDVVGKVWVWLAMLVGAGLSYALTSHQIAVASGLTFLFAEAAVFVVYTPLRRRGWTIAVASANAVGVIADTLIFLDLAGFPLSPSAVEGQFFAKVIVTVAALLLRGGVSVVSRKPLYA